MPTDDLADLKSIQTCNLTGCNDWNPDGTEGDRRRIGNQANACSINRVKAKSCEHGRRDGDRSAEPGSAFDKGAKGKRDEYCLQAPVIGNGSQGVLDNLELTGFHRHVINPDPADNDPANRKNPKQTTQ